MSEYFSNIKTGATTIATGMGITLKHFFNAVKRKGDAGIDDADYFRQVDGLCTLQYPKEAIPTPPHGRYRLYNNIDDCIGCSQCDRACPVQCITIETIKATSDDLAVCGKTSGGQQKRMWVPVFDIDTAKCMTCGICVSVCPTDCLVHTAVADFSEFDVKNMLYHFGNLSKIEAEAKKKKLAEQQAQAAKEKAAAGAGAPAAKPAPKPAPQQKPGGADQAAD
jgi:NADH-quinone oxidoreductase subunit I